MKLIKRSLAGVAAIAVLGALTLSVPRAAHAVAAALVQVSNTAAAPALTQHVPSFASQTVALFAASAPASPTGNSVAFGQLSPQGGLLSGFGYGTPSTQSLVITSVEFVPSAGTGTLDLSLVNFFSGAQYETWIKVPTNAITNLQFPNGIVIGPNVTPGLQSGSGSASAVIDAYFHGYLTSN